MESVLRKIRRLIRKTQRNVDRLTIESNRLALQRINIEMSLQETDQIQRLLLATDGLLEGDRQRRQLLIQIDELEDQRNEYMNGNHFNLICDTDRKAEAYVRETEKLDILKECYSKLKRIRST